MITRGRPGSATSADLPYAGLYDTPSPVHVARPNVEPQIAAVVERALSRDPRQLSGAEEMRAALKGQIPVVPYGPYTRKGWRIVLSVSVETAVHGSCAVVGATRAPLARAMGRWIDSLEPVRDSP